VGVLAAGVAVGRWGSRTSVVVVRRPRLEQRAA
jgi:hypothetical protein